MSGHRFESIRTVRYSKRARAFFDQDGGLVSDRDVSLRFLCRRGDLPRKWRKMVFGTRTRPRSYGYYMGEVVCATWPQRRVESLGFQDSPLLQMLGGGE